MKRILLSLFCISAFAIVSQAQDGSEYKKAIGARISSGYYDLISASYKTFVSNKGAIELNLGVRPRGGYYDADLDKRVRWATVAFSAAYQHHFAIKPVAGLQWYVGGGLTAYQSISNEDRYRGFGLGLFPTGGIDYKFGNIPLNVSADFRPTFRLVDPYDHDGRGYYNGYRSFDGGNVGIAARYTF